MQKSLGVFLEKAGKPLFFMIYLTYTITLTFNTVFFLECFLFIHSFLGTA